MSDKRKPANKIRRGDIAVTIWRNEGDKGAWYSCTPSRSYKQGDAWQDSDSFGEDDLLRLMKLLDEADSWIQGARQAERGKAA